MFISIQTMLWNTGSCSRFLIDGVSNQKTYYRSTRFKSERTIRSASNRKRRGFRIITRFADVEDFVLALMNSEVETCISSNLFLPVYTFKTLK
jgi:hypothetical protein